MIFSLFFAESGSVRALHAFNTTHTQTRTRKGTHVPSLSLSDTQQPRRSLSHSQRPLSLSLSPGAHASICGQVSHTLNIQHHVYSESFFLSISSLFLFRLRRFLKQKHLFLLLQ